ncbi:MAG: hypothetical protein ACRCVT_07400 [Leadbetterella sp.]
MRHFLLGSIFFLLSCVELFAQSGNVKIDYVENRSSVPATFEITLTIQGNQYQVGEFPIIRNTEKEARQVKHQSTTIDGKKVNIHIVKQIYTVPEGGRVSMPAENIEVNGQDFRLEARTMIFDKAVSESSTNTPMPNEIREIEDVKLELEVNRSTAFVNQGVEVSLVFYKSKNTNTNWSFLGNYANQLAQISKEIKPADCLENMYIVSSVKPEERTIGGKSFDVYTLLKAVYYPLTDGTMSFPEVELRMGKVNLNNRRSEVILRSLETQVTIYPLPSHPQKEKVVVGTFQMFETVKGGRKKSMGQPFEYQIRIEGEGNFNNLNIENLTQKDKLDVLLASSKVGQDQGKNKGNKTFNFKLIPNKEGVLYTKDYLFFVYFDPERQAYDTLFPKKNVLAVGSAIANDAANQDIFEEIEALTTTGTYVPLYKFFYGLLNIFWVGIVGIFTYILIKKKA